MGLFRCRQCKKEVSLEAAECPYCGTPYPAEYEYRGWGFEWKSPVTLFGFPLVHIAIGRDPSGKLRVAKGVIAIGQFAVGAITIAEFGVGFVFGLGQFMFGLTAVAQFAIGLCFAVGQFAAGYIAIGQFAAGYYVLAQFGLAKHLWATTHRDPAAVEFLTQLARKLGWGTR